MCKDLVKLYNLSPDTIIEMRIKIGAVVIKLCYLKKKFIFYD